MATNVEYDIHCEGCGHCTVTVDDSNSRVSSICDVCGREEEWFWKKGKRSYKVIGGTGVYQIGYDNRGLGGLSSYTKRNIPLSIYAEIKKHPSYRTVSFSYTFKRRGRWYKHNLFTKKKIEIINSPSVTFVPDANAEFPF